MRTAIRLGTLTAVLALASSAAAGPNGKPFVEINGQITEVQGDVATLEETVADLIGEVESLTERAIATQAALDALALENEDLQLQIDANAGDLVVLQGEVDNNTRMIGVMEDELMLIERELNLKQTIISGACEPGYFVVSVGEDSVVCEAEQSGNATGAHSTQVVVTRRTVKGAVVDTVVAECPEGTTLVGGGFEGPDFDILASKPVTVGTDKSPLPEKKRRAALALSVEEKQAAEKIMTNNGWEVTVRNPTKTIRSFFAHAVCLATRPLEGACSQDDIDKCGGVEIGCHGSGGVCEAVCSSYARDKCVRRLCKKCAL